MLLKFPVSHVGNEPIEMKLLDESSTDQSSGEVDCGSPRLGGPGGHNLVSAILTRSWRGGPYPLTSVQRLTSWPFSGGFPVNRGSWPPSQAKTSFIGAWTYHAGNSLMSLGMKTTRHLRSLATNDTDAMSGILRKRLPSTGGTPSEPSPCEIPSCSYHLIGSTDDPQPMPRRSYWTLRRNIPCIHPPIKSCLGSISALMKQHEVLWYQPTLPSC